MENEMRLHCSRGPGPSWPMSQDVPVNNLSCFRLLHPAVSHPSGIVRLKWAGHLARMNEDRCCKKMFLTKPMEYRPRGRPPLRWIDCVGKDINILNVKKVEMSGEGQSLPEPSSH
ncbi:hypothetical protein TNCV_926501 [Trichonephila clavipes]|nr:hypothetical protein TNCV_926501 [Trichonephila clavipes]